MHRHGNTLEFISVILSSVLVSSDYFLCHDASLNSQKLTIFIKRYLQPKFQLSGNIFSHENSLGVPEFSISIRNSVIVLYCLDNLISSSGIPILIRVLRNISRFHESRDYNLPLADFHKWPKRILLALDHFAQLYQASMFGHSTAL